MPASAKRVDTGFNFIKTFIDNDDMSVYMLYDEKRQLRVWKYNEEDKFLIDSGKLLTT